MSLKFVVAVIVILAISFTLSYPSEFSKSEIVYNLTTSEDKQADQFYWIWLYIGGAIGLVLAISTVIYKMKKK